MSSCQALGRDLLYQKILSWDIVTMMIYCHCTRKQKKCWMSSLLLKCKECIQMKKKCESAESVINFSAIDKMMKHLKCEKKKIKQINTAAWKQLHVLQAKLQQLHKQKQFLKNYKQKMFDKNLTDMKKLKHLEDLKKMTEVKKITALVQNSNEFSSVLSSDMLSWLDQATDDFKFADIIFSNLLSLRL